MRQITAEEREQFELEQSKGRKAQTVYDGYVKNFCQLKRESLFMAFSELPLTAEKELMEVKRMLYAIDTLETEIVSQINTGKMASQILTEAEPPAEDTEVKH